MAEYNANDIKISMEIDGEEYELEWHSGPWIIVDVIDSVEFSYKAPIEYTVPVMIMEA